MSRGLVLAGLVLAGMAAPMVLAMTAMTGTAANDVDLCGLRILDEAPEVVGLDAEQARNAGQIVAVGRAAGLPAFGLQIALATAMRESSLRNLDYGDRDSLGLFQQRPSTGWGTPAQVQDPVYAAQAFFGGTAGPNDGEPPGLLDIPGWEEMTLTEAAQAVQRSAYPDAYARWGAAAQDWLTDLLGTDGPLLGADGARCSEPAWVVPLAGDYTITAQFGQRGERWATVHTGIDLAAPIGRDVVAAGSGRVTYATWDGPYGRKVEITHPDGTRTWYAHLSAIAVPAGSTVAAGDVIGQVGMTGNATGPHLHVEVRPMPHGGPVDPVPWLAARAVSL